MQHENFTHMVEGLTIENETLKANIEALTMELEENKNEIKKLKEENELIQLEMETAMEMPKISEGKIVIFFKIMSFFNNEHSLFFNFSIVYLI